MNKIVKIGFPMEYEDDKHIIRTGLWLKEYEVEALEKRLNEYNYLQSKIDKIKELKHDWTDIVENVTLVFENNNLIEFMNNLEDILKEED